MLRHFEDGSPLNVLVNNEGQMLIVCLACKRVWTTKLEPTAFPATTEGLEANGAALGRLGFDAEATIAALAL
jgi:hypothetical protein